MDRNSTGSSPRNLDILRKRTDENKTVLSLSVETSKKNPDNGYNNSNVKRRGNISFADVHKKIVDVDEKGKNVHSALKNASVEVHSSASSSKRLFISGCDSDHHAATASCGLLMQEEEQMY